MQTGVTAFSIDCHADSPLLLGSRRAVGNTLPTLDYIQGSTLRGALAGVHQSMPDRHQDWDAFLSISFPDLIPDRAEAIPLSARSCKYTKGFRPSGHGVRDTLLADADELATCECGADLKPFIGWMMLSATSAQRIESGRLAIGHTAIDRLSRTAAPGMYFVEEQIVAASSFGGCLLVPRERTDFAKALLHVAASSGIFVGRGKSRGLGKLTLNFSTEIDPVERMDDRWAGLQQRLIWANLDASSFTVTLASRAVLLDRYLQGKTALEPADLWNSCTDGNLREQMAAILARYQLKRCFSRSSVTHGWNAQSGLARSADIALRQGSTFLYALRPDSPKLQASEISQLLTGFVHLEEVGIGERTGEGFGRIVLCHPFHWRGLHGGRDPKSVRY